MPSALNPASAVVPASRLQEQLESLWRLAPRLCPVVRPKGMDDVALLALAEREPNGSTGVEHLHDVLQSAASRCTACGICGQAGEAAASQDLPDGEAEDPATLRFSTAWRLNFQSKTMALTKGQFSCGYCRSLLGTSAFVNAAATGDRGPGAEDCGQLLKTLSRHFVELNAPDGIDPANEVAAAAWTQEVFALAYSLQVVASNVRGWKVTDESLQQLKYRSSTGATAALAKSLLSQAASSKSAIKGSAKANKKRKTMPKQDDEVMTPRNKATVAARKQSTKSAVKSTATRPAGAASTKKKRRMSN